MKRRRFFAAVTAALLAVTMITAGLILAAPAMAQGNSGKNKGGGGGGGDSTPPTVTFHLTFLETPEWISNPVVQNANNNGDIVGSGTHPGAEWGPTYYRAYLYTAAEGFIDINSLPAMDDWPGWTATSAHSINDSGEITLLMVHPENGKVAVFLYEPIYGSLTFIDEVAYPLQMAKIGSRINAGGDIAYTKYDADGYGTWHFYDSESGLRTNLGITGNDTSEGLVFRGGTSGINAEGEIVGGVWEGGIVRYSTKTGQRLDLVKGRQAMKAQINDLGDICFNGEFKGKNMQPARYVSASGVTQILNKSGRVMDINYSSDVLFVDRGYLFVATYDRGNVSVDDRITGTPEALSKWWSRPSGSTRWNNIRMTNRDEEAGFGQVCGDTDLSDNTKELFILTPIAVSN